MQRVAGLSILALCATTLVAQGGEPPAALTRAASTSPATAATNTPAAVAFEVYSAHDSRLAFMACDANGDDRLSVLEATRAIENLGSRLALEPFRALDTNSDGYLDWPEFDARFRMAIDNGNAFRIRPLRPIEVLRTGFARTGSTAIRAPETQAEKLIRTLDRDGDGQISVQELEPFARQLGLQGQAGAALRLLDRDNSGTLSAAEIEPLAARLMAAAPAADGADAPGGGRRVLPPEFLAADTNGDGVVQRDELHAVLLSIHPSLARFTDRILMDADTNRSGGLGAAELQRAVGRMR